MGDKGEGMVELKSVRTLYLIDQKVNVIDDLFYDMIDSCKTHFQAKALLDVVTVSNSNKAKQGGH